MIEYILLSQWCVMGILCLILAVIVFKGGKA